MQGIGGGRGFQGRGYGNDRPNSGRGSSNRVGAAGGGEGSINSSGNKRLRSDDPERNVFKKQRGPSGPNYGRVGAAGGGEGSVNSSGNKRSRSDDPERNIFKKQRGPGGRNHSSRGGEGYKGEGYGRGSDLPDNQKIINQYRLNKNKHRNLKKLLFS